MGWLPSKCHKALVCECLCSVLPPLQVKTALELQAAELVECRAKLSRTQQRERESGALVQELTSMVKEQKARIGELVRSKREVVTELKVGGTVCGT